MSIKSCVRKQLKKEVFRRVLISFLSLKKEKYALPLIMSYIHLKIKKMLKKFLIYMQTDFVRFLISLLKITHDMMVKTWRCVPFMNH